jgi:hypothetical protein
MQLKSGMRLVEVRTLPSEAQLHIIVEVPESHYHTASQPVMASRLLRLLPGLKRHQCENPDELPFDAEIFATETGHLLEHMILEFQSKVYPSERFSGETTWETASIGSGRGIRFDVRVTYVDQVVAQAAAVLAIRVIEAINGRIMDHISVEEEVRRLQMIALCTVRLPVVSPPNAASLVAVAAALAPFALTI